MGVGKRRRQERRRKWRSARVVEYAFTNSTYKGEYAFTNSL